MMDFNEEHEPRFLGELDIQSFRSEPIDMTPRMSVRIREWFLKWFTRPFGKDYEYPPFTCSCDPQIPGMVPEYYKRIGVKMKLTGNQASPEFMEVAFHEGLEVTVDGRDFCAEWLDIEKGEAFGFFQPEGNPYANATPDDIAVEVIKSELHKGTVEVKVNGVEINQWRMSLTEEEQKRWF